MIERDVGDFAPYDREPRHVIGRLVRGRGTGRRPKPFFGRVLTSAHKAGNLSQSRRRNARSTFGRGRPAAFLITRSHDRSRRIVVKTRVVRQKAGASAPLSAQLCYLRRDG